jgi:glycine cleavage system H protein
MASPDDRKYLASHEWHKPDGDLIVVGISQFAVDELTDITFLEITAEGQISAGDEIGEIESVKATSELYTGVGGEVVEINQAVMDDPSIINEDCYGKGWMLKIRPSDPADYDKLIASHEYNKQGH